jgi:hypothetical protein
MGQAPALGVDQIALKHCHPDRLYRGRSPA